MSITFLPVIPVPIPIGWRDPTDADLAAIEADWRNRALCAQTDPEAFFPEKGGSTRDAKKVCARCEVRAECLKDALGRKELHGIWGGTSDRERRRLLREAS